MKKIDFSFGLKAPYIVGILVCCSVLQAQVNAQTLKYLNSIPSSWPNWIRNDINSSLVRQVPGEGLFVCIDGTVPQNVKASNADPAISVAARKAAKCPPRTVIMRAIQPLRDPRQMPFVCIIISNPEERYEENKPLTSFDTTTGRIIYTPPEQPLCPKGTTVRTITPSTLGKPQPKGIPDPGTRPNTNQLKKNPAEIFSRINRRQSLTQGYNYTSTAIPKITKGYKGMEFGISQVQPEYSLVDAPLGGHSIGQMAIFSADKKNRVELGWQVSKNLYKDTKPHLFIFRNVNGVGVYNDLDSGFISMSSIVYPTMPVTISPSGTVYTYKILHNDTLKRWELFYRGTMFGYYPDSLWNNAFTRGDITNWYGEVYGNIGNTCTDMGNGILGSTTGSALMARPASTKADGTLVYLTPTNILTLVTNPTFYNFSSMINLSSTTYGIRFGGPGKGRCP